MRETMIREHHLCNDEQTKRLRDDRMDTGLPKHVSPCSTLIAGIGQHWRPGCWESMMAMARATWEAGYESTLYEEQDRCYNPYDGLGIMRNQAYMRAIREGYEYLCYVDNDVQAPPDTLVRLLGRCVPIISPVVQFADGQSHGLKMPTMPRNQGLAMVPGAIVLSFLVIRTTVFLPWAMGGFWGSEIGADETYHFNRLAMTGHYPFVDTDVVVTCVDPPHFPFDRIRDRTAADLAAFRPKEPTLWRP